MFCNVMQIAPGVCSCVLARARACTRLEMRVLMGRLLGPMTVAIARARVVIISVLIGREMIVRVLRSVIEGKGWRHLYSPSSRSAPLRGLNTKPRS